jgi:beta-N-acetylhexosaminidase
MRLEQQIAQLLIVGFAGNRLSPTSQLALDLKETGLGGVILFDRLIASNTKDNNILSTEQTSSLCRDLQEFAGGDLLIAVDQEGGRVSRFKAERGFPTTDSAARLGLSKDPAATRDSALQTAGMLAGMGINLNLAPVVDLNLREDNPIISRYERSFGRDPAEVSLHAAAWVDAHRQHGILSCLKHFPGHGSSATDSHLGFVDISETWDPIELQPYRDLIGSGRADIVMAGHLFNSRIDRHLPATLSRPTIDGLLRHDLGFSGPVITDDMQMRAITDHYGLAEATVMALTAGADIIIIGNNLQHDPLIARKIIRHITGAVREGDLAEERISEAWQRVQDLKRKIHRDIPCNQTVHQPTR